MHERKVVQLKIEISQGNAATDLRQGDRIYSNIFHTKSLQHNVVLRHQDADGSQMQMTT